MQRCLQSAVVLLHCLHCLCASAYQVVLRSTFSYPVAFLLDPNMVKSTGLRGNAHPAGGLKTCAACCSTRSNKCLENQSHHRFCFCTPLCGYHLERALQKQVDASSICHCLGRVSPPVPLKLAWFGGFVDLLCRL